MNKNTCERARTWVLTMLTTLSIALAGTALLPQSAFAQEDDPTPIVGQKTTAPAIEGIEILNIDSNTVEMAVNDSTLFNPASNTKLATTLLVLQKFGPDYVFKTTIKTDGTIGNDGVLHGNLYVEGNYMLFGDKQAHDLAKILNDKGIRKIDGDLYVSPSFTMRLQYAGLDAGRQLLTILDPNNPAGAIRHVKVSKKSHRFSATPPPPPQVRFTGKLKVGTATGDNLTVLATHNSPPLKDILKIMLCYSDNTMAEKFGQMIGGPAALNDLVVNTLGAPAAEVSFSTTSGLGINRITPRAMMKVVVALRQYVIDHNLALSDFLPVAGVDDGTLKGRLNATGQAGSVIAKTGTLNPTDGGVSALSGEMHTGGPPQPATTDTSYNNYDWNEEDAPPPPPPPVTDSTTTATTSTGPGTYLFVIFEMHGDVNGFRQAQDKIVTDFQNAHNGPQAITYTTILPRIVNEDSWDLSQPAAPATGN